MQLESAKLLRRNSRLLLYRAYLTLVVRSVQFLRVSSRNTWLLYIGYVELDVETRGLTIPKQGFLMSQRFYTLYLYSRSHGDVHCQKMQKAGTH